MRGIRASQHTCQTLHQSYHTFFIHVIMVWEHLGLSCKDSFISVKCCVEVVALSRSVHYYISIGEMSELRHLPQFKCRQKDKKEWFNTCQALFFIERFRPLSSDEPPPPHSFLVELMPDNALVCLSFDREFAMIFSVPLMCCDYRDVSLLTSVHPSQRATASFDSAFTGSKDALYIQPSAL